MKTSPISPRAILIDLDGTLADSLAVMRSAYQQFLEGFQVQGTDDEFASLNGPPLHEVVRLLKANHRLAGDADALTAQYFHVIDQLYEGVIPSPGARELLTKAKEHGCLVCIVTSNSTKRTHAWLALVGLAQWVDFIVSGDDVKYGKPHPEPYLLASKRVDCPITGIIAVEDSIQGAQSSIGAGLKTYLVTRLNEAPVVVNGVMLVRSLGCLVNDIWGPA